MTPIRQASGADVESMIELAAMKRDEYEEYSPVFWRPANGAQDAQRKFFARLVEDSGWI